MGKNKQTTMFRTCFYAYRVNLLAIILQAFHQ